VLADRIEALRGVGLLPLATLPAPEELRRYRIGLIVRLVQAGRLDDAARQIDTLEENGGIREAQELRLRLSTAQP